MLMWLLRVRLDAEIAFSYIVVFQELLARCYVIENWNPRAHLAAQFAGHKNTLVVGLRAHENGDSDALPILTYLTIGKATAQPFSISCNNRMICESGFNKNRGEVDSRIVNSAHRTKG